MDNSGNGYTGQVNGTQVVTGLAGYGRQLSTLSDWISATAGPSLNLSGALTLEAWIKIADLSDYQMIINKAPNAGSLASFPGNFDFYVAPAGNLWFLHEIVGGGWKGYVSSATVPVNVWTHVAVTWGSGHVIFYLNGLPVTNVTDAGETALTNSPTVRIGQRADSRGFRGVIDEVKIWSYARTAGQIATTVYPQTNCPAANPYDNTPDDAALQACLNKGGETRLWPGTPGYILAGPLQIGTDNTVLTSTSTATRATLIASSTLNNNNTAAPGMFTSSGHNNLSVSFITFDGNRPARTAELSTLCAANLYRGAASNVTFGATTHLAFDDNESTRTLCGSALQVDGTTFELARNLIDDNGHGTENQDAPQPWSDGMTLLKCAGGNVHNNTIRDATDVAIVTGGGACLIQNNVIMAQSRHAFAGIGLGAFSPLNGNHTGTIVSGNQITASFGRMGFGLSLGLHPWNPSVYTTGGTVQANSVSGAIVNIAVDGTNSLTVSGNTMSIPQGSPKCGGSPTNYTAAHFDTSSNLQSGYVIRLYDGCLP